MTILVPDADLHRLTVEYDEALGVYREVYRRWLRAWCGLEGIEAAWEPVRDQLRQHLTALHVAIQARAEAARAAAPQEETEAPWQ